LYEAEIRQLLGRTPRLKLEDIVAHPRLPEAIKVYLDRFLDVYGGDPFLVRLLIETGRFFVFALIFVIEGAQDPERPETWPTVGLLKQHMASFGVASGRHVDELIARLCAVGYMEMQPSEVDRRVRILRPTEKLRAHDRDWLAAHYSHLALAYPGHDYEPVMQRDPEFQQAHRSVCLPIMPLATKIFFSVSDVMLFMNRAAGVMVLAALLQDALMQPDYPHAAVPYGDVGDRFGVSRTHVRQLLVAAEEAGLVKLHARGGRKVEILPRLWSSYARGIAGGMYIQDVVYLAALRHYSSDKDLRGPTGKSAQSFPDQR
jgi:hypothetical protein